MKLKEIAERINVHLKRIEHDPTLNPEDRKFRTRPYYYAGAWVGGSRIGLKYVSYQGESHISKTEAEQYLAWLDAGNVGKYWEMDRQLKAAAGRAERKEGAK